MFSEDRKMPKVGIVVCAYQNCRLTDNCLSSLQAQTYKNHKIVLADDCSGDGSVEFLREKYPELVVLENRRNSGPAKTRNNGLSLIEDVEYVVTMDNDAALSEDWLEKMVAFMGSDASIGQAVGKILFLDDPGKIAAAGGSFHFRGKSQDMGFGQPADSPEYNQRRDVSVACSASMIVRRSILERVGGFCDVYYHGYEDSDLSLRINAAGYRVVYHPEAVSYHGLSRTVNQTIGQTSAKRVYYWTRNRLLTMFRNYELVNLLRFLPLNLRFTLSDCKTHPRRIPPVLGAWLWIVAHLPGIVAQRRRINAIRRTSDCHLHHMFNLR